MRTQCGHRQRRGATVVEYSLVCSALVLVLFGILVAGMGVFRYQQVSLLAREGARWASVHGALYAKETGLQAASAADVFTQAIQSRAVALDPTLLSSTVTWNTSNQPYHYDTVSGTYIANTVTVTLSYNWIPEWAGSGMTLTSSSTVPMFY